MILSRPTPPQSLVIGASGMVGSLMLNALGQNRFLAASRTPRSGWLTLDLAEMAEPTHAAAILDSSRLDALYCIGGMTYVDGCESQPELAFRTNARGPGILAGYAHSRGLPFVYFSTEYVFDGSDSAPGPYNETSPTNALSVYGKSKLEGEHRVLAAHPGALVLRTTVVYGPDPGQKNFLYSLIRTLAAGSTMRVPQDQISTPTYCRDLIRATMTLVNAGASGVFHVCGSELMGRLEFAQKGASILGLDSSLLHGVPTAELRQIAPRPLQAGLAIHKLRNHFPALKMGTVAENLVECAEEMLQSQRKID